jgi:hypothetical protein
VRQGCGIAIRRHRHAGSGLGSAEESFLIFKGRIEVLEAPDGPLSTTKR